MRHAKLQSKVQDIKSKTIKNEVLSDVSVALTFGV